MSILIGIAVIAALAAILIAGVAFGITRLYRKVEQGQAMVLNRTKSMDVTFSGALVIPVVHKAEMMDISVKPLRIERSGKEGLICKDNIRADIKVSFYVRVNPNREAVLEVAQLIGCTEASNPATLDTLFGAKFSEALKTVGKQMNFTDLYDKREDFRNNVIVAIGKDLNGYQLDDVAIEYLEQTNVVELDPNNILDAEGIRKITEITTSHQVVTNELNREAEKKTKQKDVETTQALFELDRQEKAAEYRANREMATTKAKEEAATAEVEAQERQRAEAARLAADEAIGVRNENASREIEVAAKARERAIAVEAEKVEEARQLQVLARETQTTAATRELETAKTETARLAKDRVAGEKAVAVEEESIKTLRVVEDANRHKEATVIEAGAEAEAGFITEIKAAEAAERSAQHRAQERLTIAQAEETAATHESQAKIKIAEGVKAEAAATGLAEVEVQVAAAAAIEQTGLAQAKVKVADADAEAKLGEARGTAIRATGTAEGDAIKAKLTGEAAGLSDKADAMAKIEGVGKDYDLTLRRIDVDKEIALAQITTQGEVGKAQAEAMAGALAAANIDIVGGTDLFVDRLIGGVTTGRTIDSVVKGSETLSAVAKPYTSGDKDLLGLLGSTVAGLGADGMRDLTVAGLLGTLAANTGGANGGVLSQIVDALKEKGLDGIAVADLIGGAGTKQV